MKRIYVMLMLLMVASFSIGCQSLDVVGKTAVTTFDAVLKVDSNRVILDEALNSWSLNSPENERFIWSQDFSSKEYSDFVVEIDATPFIDAGLDVTRLENDQYIYDASKNTLQLHFDVGNTSFDEASLSKPIDTFNAIVKAYRDLIGYHEALDHYGIKLGNGNMFEWAKNMDTNELDIVFVLEPKPFIDAGLDPTKIASWKYAQVEIKNEQGKEVLVYKFLKPYNLK